MESKNYGTKTPFTPFYRRNRQTKNSDGRRRLELKRPRIRSVWPTPWTANGETEVPLFNGRDEIVRFLTL